MWFLNLRYLAAPTALLVTLDLLRSTVFWLDVAAVKRSKRHLKSTKSLALWLKALSQRSLMLSIVHVPEQSWNETIIAIVLQLAYRISHLFVFLYRTTTRKGSEWGWRSSSSLWNCTIWDVSLNSTRGALCCFPASWTRNRRNLDDFRR